MCEKAIEKSWIITFFCLCSQVCIHKFSLMYHFEAKHTDIKSRAPFSRHFRNGASQECPLCFVGSHQTAASNVAVVAADVVEPIYPMGRSHHPYEEVVFAQSLLAAVADLPAAASVIFLTLVQNWY